MYNKMGLSTKTFAIYFKKQTFGNDIQILASNIDPIVLRLYIFMLLSDIQCNKQ